MGPLRFINVEKPGQAKSAAERCAELKAVRQGAALSWWSRDADTRRQALARRRACLEDARAWSILLTESEATPAEKSLISLDTSGMSSQILAMGPPWPSLMDPSWTAPAAWHPYDADFVDQYMANMTRGRADSEGPEDESVLQAQWSPPATLSQAALSHATMLLSASHLYSAQQEQRHAPALLQLKQKVIRLINKGLSDPAIATSDLLIGAVATLAIYEALFGTSDACSLHIAGLRQMIEMRGGLDELGMDGLLQRFVTWVDLNIEPLVNSPGVTSDQLIPGRSDDMS